MNIIKNSPDSDDSYILSLNPNESLRKLLTDQYWILNSTPKIWYGIGDDKIDPDNPSQPHDKERDNKFYKNGFVVPKKQFHKIYSSPFLS